jgi:hypothetical protein
MSRHPNTNASGRPFDPGIVEAVWDKAPVSAEHPPLRVGALGALIWKPAYGNTNSKLGWEIDHIQPVAMGGGDALENLQPLQWEDNRRKGDEIPNDNGHQASGFSRAT